MPDSSKKSKTEKATDDYHYEKFKKQFRRYWMYLIFEIRNSNVQIQTWSKNFVLSKF